METLRRGLIALFGETPAGLDASQMLARAVVVYLYAIVLLRLADKRFLGRHSAVDVVLGFMLGSLLSRAVTGNSPFLPTLAGSAGLVMVHWLFAGIAARWDGFGTLVKGHARRLVRDGKVDTVRMRKSGISRADLQQALRSAGLGDDLDRIREAVLERDGSISFELTDGDRG